MPSELQKELRRTRKRMEEQFSSAQIWFLTYSLLAIVLYSILTSVLVLQHPASPWYLENPPANTADLIAYWTLGLAIVGGLLVALPWTYAIFWRHYTFVWRHLKYTDLTQLVADEQQWVLVIEQGRRSFWNRLTNLHQPCSLQDQIDLAADYWQYALAKSRNEHHRAERALAIGNLTRLADDIATRTFNLGCGIGCLMFGAGILVALAPLVVAIMYYYLKQSATKAALIDFFREKPEINRAKLAPLPGVEISQEG